MVKLCACLEFVSVFLAIPDLHKSFTKSGTKTTQTTSANKQSRVAPCRLMSMRERLSLLSSSVPRKVGTSKQTVPRRNAFLLCILGGDEKGTKQGEN